MSVEANLFIGMINTANVSSLSVSRANAAIPGFFFFFSLFPAQGASSLAAFFFTWTNVSSRANSPNVCYIWENNTGSGVKELIDGENSSHAY